MTTLLVSPFAPYRDGIAAYAVQELRRRRQQGEDVEVLSPLPSAARWHLKLGGPSGMVRLGAKAADYERTVIQFAPEMLFGRCGSAAQRTAVWAGLAGVARRTSLDLRIHEVEYGPLEQNPLERRAAAFALGQADRVTVHTEAERQSLNDLINLGRRVEVVEHGRDFLPAVVRSRSEARRELGLPDDQFIFVAIGFLQHHKGFDLAVEAIDRMSSAQVSKGGAHLHIVGSARVDHPDIAGYVEQLRSRCQQVAAATLHQRFVSDVEFDLWLQASDAVVLPYREIWSSGVVERARLFGIQVLASDLSELRDQSPPGTVFFQDIDELSIAMEKLSAASRRYSPNEGSRDGHRAENGRSSDDRGSTWIVDPHCPDRASIEHQIISRARTARIDDSGAQELRPVAGAIDPLLSLGQLHRPQAMSARPGVTPVKRFIERLVSWQVEPLATQIEGLQRATIAAVARLDQATDDRSQDDQPEGGG